jgi:hypothetical protein
MTATEGSSFLKPIAGPIIYAGTLINAHLVLKEWIILFKCFISENAAHVNREACTQYPKSCIHH